MSVHADDNLGTTAVRQGYDFDRHALAEWMRAYIDGFAGPMVVEQFKGQSGRSGPAPERGDGQRAIRRTTPSCVVLPARCPSWVKNWPRQYPRPFAVHGDSLT